MTAIKKIVPDEVLNELGELAAIPPGIGLWRPHEKFVFDVSNCIRAVHDYGNILDASKLKRLKEIAYHADELAQHLKASDKKKLFAVVSSDTIRGITGLARGARRAKLLAKAPRQGKWPVKIRKAYVEGILDAAAAAGGRLTLNRRKEGGSLVDALELIDPYLPKEGALLPLSKEWSFSTYLGVVNTHSDGATFKGGWTRARSRSAARLRTPYSPGLRGRIRPGTEQRG